MLDYIIEYHAANDNRVGRILFDGPLTLVMRLVDRLEFEKYSVEVLLDKGDHTYRLYQTGDERPSLEAAW
jgi:hypothetical protein